MSDFSGVEDTLFIPLVARIYASKNWKEYFYDEKALELEKYITSDMIKDNTGEYFTIASIARFYEFDKLVKEFISKYSDPNIILIGCGLETMYFRANSSKGTFYEVDFPSVIEQRKKILGENKNEVLIGSDILDFTWIDHIDVSKPTLVIASGVFQYLHEKDVLLLIKELQARFNNIELAFDATNKTGIKGAENYVKKTGNTSAMMYFYVQKVKDFVNKSNTSLIRVIPFYGNSKKILKKKLKFSTKFSCHFGDRLGFTKIIYLKIK